MWRLLIAGVMLLLPGCALLDDNGSIDPSTGLCYAFEVANCSNRHLARCPAQCPEFWRVMERLLEPIDCSILFETVLGGREAACVAERGQVCEENCL